MLKLQLDRIEFVHSRNFIYRDIKPSNFLMGIGPSAHTVYLIDFGLSQRYCDDQGQHVPYNEDTGLWGTARYASLNAHRGVQQSRRDDLEAIAYMLIYFARGSLPWQGIKGDSRDQYDSVLDMKADINILTFCRMHALPSEFGMLLRYARSLPFEDKPDYPYLRSLFLNLYDRKGFSGDQIFDWDIQVTGPTQDRLRNIMPCPSPRPGTPRSKPVTPASTRM